MKGDPEFVILKYQAWMETSEFETKILGAVVREPLSPSTNYVPDFPLRYKTDDLQKGTVTDFVLTGSGTITNERAASIKAIGGLAVHGNKQDSIHLAGKFISYKRIQQLDKFWAGLKEDQDVKKTVPLWMSFYNTRPVCLVVGIMVCEDVELSMSGDMSRTYEGNVEFPIGQVIVTTTTGPFQAGEQMNPQVQFSSASQKATIFKARMGKSSIFAVEVRKITTNIFMSEVLHLTSKGVRGKVGGPRFAGRVSYANQKSEDEPVEAEEMVVDECGPEDFEVMVG